MIPKRSNVCLNAELTVNGDAAESFRVNLWLKWSLFYSINESVSYLYISAAEPACSACATTTSACCSTCVVCRFVNGRNVRQMGGWLIDGPMVGPRND